MGYAPKVEKEWPVGLPDTGRSSWEQAEEGGRSDICSYTKVMANSTTEAEEIPI